jgi:hypothetical protein
MLRAGKRFAIRKTTHITNRVMQKYLYFSIRVENKATRILDGTDFSIDLEETIPLEKIYYSKLHYILPVNPALPRTNQKPTVVLFLPSLKASSFFGGTATALVVAAMTARLSNMPLRIVQTLENGHEVPEKISEFLRAEGVAFDPKLISILSVAERAYNVYGYIPMTQDDIFIASAWWDAHLISRLPLNKRFIYLVQDFEPIFYNNSDLYVLAEETYKMKNFIPLCNTRIMFDFMKDRNYAAFDSSAEYFEPAVSRLKSGQANKKGSDQKRRLFLYGRPDVHRNLFFTALDAVDHAFREEFLDKDGWEVFMAGQDKLPNLKLSSGIVVKKKGKMDMDNYIAFSKTVDIAVSPMMAPHPNYPTLEFASIGTAVVTTKYANKQNLDRYSGNIIMSDIASDSMAGAIRIAAGLSYDTRIENLKSNTIEGSWEKSLGDVLQRVLKKL